jgi:hypothetical protein
VSFESRLRRLEERWSGRCQECGLPPDGPGRLVVTGEGYSQEGLTDDPEERCTRCGRLLWCVIEVVYDDGGRG